MRFHRNSAHRTHSSLSRRLILAFVIAAMAFPFTPAQAGIAGRQALSLIDSTAEISESIKSFLRSGQGFQQFPQQEEMTAEDRAQRVTRLRLCPRRVTLYFGESRTLVPLAINHTNRDQDGEPEVIHGAVIAWETSDPSVATVTSYGEVEAVGAGRARITARAGSARAVVLVNVEAGARPVEEDFEYDPRHAQDCEDPEAEDVQDTGAASVKHLLRDDDRIEEASRPASGSSAARLKALARPALLRSETPGSIKPATAAMAGTAFNPSRTISKREPSSTSLLQSPPPLIDGSGPDGSAPQAVYFNNAVGSPRFSPQESVETAAVKTRKNLGSFNYQFAAPVLTLGGRGIGVNLAMVYNSRLWNKDFSTMTFNYDKGWPAAGWRVGYGRIIKNYDNTATGDKSGSGSSNAPGNFLLIQPDGTRVHLAQYYDAIDQVYKLE